MLPFNEIYVLLAILVFCMNVVPMFMPPTWIILAFFYAFFGLDLLPTVIIGATMATSGRIVLAHLSKTHFRGFLPKKMLHNYDALGNFLKKKQKFTIPIILTYAFFPVSSNYVFIIAGITKLSIKIISFSFFIGRLFSYSFWVTASFHASRQLGDIFGRHLSQGGTLVIEILGLIFIFVIGRINWHKILKLAPLENKGA